MPPCSYGSIAGLPLDAVVVVVRRTSALGKSTGGTKRGVLGGNERHGTSEAGRGGERTLLGERLCKSKSGVAFGAV